MKNLKIFLSSRLVLINLAVIVLLFLVPYYLFDGRLFIGGDDTRLYYIYPLEWIKNFAFYSWFNFSSLGIFNPNQFIIPILLLLIPFNWIIENPLVINYAIFSLVLIFGFISFQLFIPQLVQLKKSNERFTVFSGALFYILSPIFLMLQFSNFFYSVWLIGLIPLISYFFLRFLKTYNLKFVFLASVSAIIFSIALISFPWTLGFLLSCLPALIFSFLIYSRSEIIKFAKKSLFFWSFLILSQAFWFLSFVLNFLFSERSSLGGQVLSQNPRESFINTVQSTASGNIIYPLLNLFQRKIAFDFQWSQESIFLSFYDKTIYINIIFPLLLFSGIFLFRKILDSSEKKIFTLLLISFMSSLFLFTVNIGFLRSIFLGFGFIPGFIMFANFWNKFDLSYVFLYSVSLTVSLLIIGRYLKNRMLFNSLIALFLLLIFINVMPAKSLVNSPIWNTRNTYSTLIIPAEYNDFIRDTRKLVNKNSNILSLPFGGANYAFIKGEEDNTVFVGTSPVKLFTGINDFSGELSFSAEDSARFKKFIRKKDYDSILKFFQEYNISYILLVRNLPSELKKTNLFDENLDFDYKNLLRAVASEKLLTSAEENYELYKTANDPSLFDSENISFQKLSPVKYKISIKNLKEPQELIFLDSFNSGWKLFLNSDPSPALLDVGDLSFTWKKYVFDDTHDLIYNYANLWVIDKDFVVSNYSKDFYVSNPDDSINLELILYFKPQNYFYLGTIISIISIFFMGLYLIKKRV